MVGLVDDRETIVLETLDEPALPQGLRAIEPLGEDPRGQQTQLLEVTRSRERGMAHVVLEVERRVVDPQRPSHLEAREGELLAVARHAAQPRGDVLEEVLTPGRRSL